VFKRKKRKKNKEVSRKTTTRPAPTHNRADKNPSFFVLPHSTQKLIWGMLMFLMAVIVALSFFEKAGIAGRKFKTLTVFLIGDAVYTIPLFLILIGIVFIKTRHRRFLSPLILGILILILGVSGILESLTPDLKKGGWLGYILASLFLKVFGFLATQIIFSSFIIIGSLIFWQLLALPLLRREEEEEVEKKRIITRVFDRVKNLPKFKVKEVPPLLSEKSFQAEPEAPSLELKVEKVSRNSLISEYEIPPLDLFGKEKEIPAAGDTRTNSAVIKKTLENFGIPVEMAEINIGPTVTQYALKPAEGIKLSKITALSNNLSLALASHPIRIETPIPGRSLVGIEVPNKVRARVRLRTLISKPTFQESSSNLTFVLGRDVSGNPVYADLGRMPHLLVAGATGTGKTIFLNSLILSFLYQNGPESLRLILIDPKRVEFSVYNKLPHLLCPVIYNASKTVDCLKWLISEMGRRFDILSIEKVRNIGTYNEIIFKNGKKPLPYIVLIIDELADLIVAKGKEVEAGIVRLAQLARAVGIHLVVATQRPSVEVITGLIKANITSRVSFQVASQIDSRTVLDMAGAEKLLGLGDMLFLSAEIVQPKRIQAAYVSEKELKKVANWIKSKSEDTIFEDSLTQDLQNSLETAEMEAERVGMTTRYDEEDPLYPEAKQVVIEYRRASASLLQRKLRIGYARAARLIDILEERGVVGPSQGAKPREVYISDKNDQQLI